MQDEEDDDSQEVNFEEMLDFVETDGEDVPAVEVFTVGSGEMEGGDLIFWGRISFFHSRSANLGTTRS